MTMNSSKKTSFLSKCAAAPHIVWMVLFIVAPLLFVLYFSLTDASGNFSFSNFVDLSSYVHIFTTSVGFALIATVVSLLIGYPLAYFISNQQPKLQKCFLILLMLPMWINLLIRVYSLMALLDNGGLVNSFLQKIGLSPITFIGTGGAVILGMVYDYLPYMVLPIYTVISKLDKKYMEAAEDLGCSHLHVMTKVILPLSVPGIISGITMVFVPSISTFYISQKLGGGSIELIGDTIERQFQNTNTYHVGAAISFVMMILIIVSIAIMNKYSEDKGGASK